MCGIIGATGGLYKKEKSVLQGLFFMNALRGTDGCGFFTLYSDYQKGKTTEYYNVYKFEEPSFDISLSSAWEKAVENKTSLKTFIGHSRAATKGEVSIKNNHPFEAGHIIGVHNGTIHGKFGDKTHKFETDSEAFFNEISEHGLKKALEIVHDDSYSAAYAISFYDLSNDTITLYRNAQRPLYLAKSGSDFFWASEKEMLEFAFNRSKVSNYKIDEIPVHSLVRIFPGKTEPKERLKIIPNYFTPKTKGYSRESWTNGWSNYQQKANNYSLPDYSKSAGTSKEDKEHSNFSKDLLDGLGDNNNDSHVCQVSPNVLISWKWLKKEVLDNGCAYCSKVETNLNKIKFNNSGTEYYCQECTDNLKALGVDYNGLFRPRMVKQ